MQPLQQYKNVKLVMKWEMLGSGCAVWDSQLKFRGCTATLHAMVRLIKLRAMKAQLSYYIYSIPVNKFPVR